MQRRVSHLRCKKETESGAGAKYEIVSKEAIR